MCAKLVIVRFPRRELRIAQVEVEERRE